MTSDPPFTITKDTKITLLSGAGISAESGVPTFRSADGLWSDENIAKLATPSGFMADPKRGWEFYGARRQNMSGCLPNHAHKSLAQLERDGFDVVIITQNIDGFHTEAGSKNVIEIHGSIWEIKCSNPRCELVPFENRESPMTDLNPECDLCGSPLRPNVVFFEEMLDETRVRHANERTFFTDLFLVIGTSGVVYPAAGFAQMAKMQGAFVVELNLEATPLSGICDMTRPGPCGETLPKLLKEFSGGEFSYKPT